MPTPIMSLEDWLDKTKSLLKARSTELQALDTAIKNYHAGGAAEPRLKADLEKHLDAWKRSQGPGDAWKRSVRNRGGYVELLTKQLEGGDTDAVWGLTPDYMHETLINDRLGVLYLFDHVTVEPELFNVILEGGISMVGSTLSFAGAAATPGTWGGGLGDVAAQHTAAAMQTTMVVGSPILEGAWAAAHEPVVKQSARSKLDDWLTTLRKWFREFVQGLIAKLKETWQCELPAGLVLGLINTICSLVLSATQSGIVSGAIDTTKGVILTVDSVLTRVAAWQSGKNVTFVSGHPAATVDAIKRGMNLSIGEGLWKFIKGVGNIGLAFGTAGAGLIAGIVIAAAEMVTKIVIRLFEVTYMGKFFEEASAHWRNRNAADAIHLQPFAFGKFYRKYALVTPALAVLTLNSGICGSKMSWLSMFKEDSNPISSQEFINGANHVDSLKVWGAEYLQSAGFSFKSSDRLVGSLLQFSAGELKLGGQDAKAHTRDLSTRGAKVRNWLKRAAS